MDVIIAGAGGHGRVVFEGTPADLQANHAVTQTWLEV